MVCAHTSRLSKNAVLTHLDVDNTGAMMRMATVCREFTRIATAVLDKTEKEMSARQKRKQERDREKIVKVSERQQQKSVSISSAQLPVGMCLEW